MKLLCIGAGYVGTPTMAVIAQKCPHYQVVVVDSNFSKIDLWNSDNISDFPVYENGLSKIILECRNKNLFFLKDIKSAIEEADIIFISVNTPTKKTGIGKGMASNLTYVESCARDIMKYSKSDKIVVEKSTLPVRTASTIKAILNENIDVNFEVISNPEFLAEGTAIQDLINPSRVLIGSDTTESGLIAMEIVKKIYLNWVDDEKIITTNLWSSELSKLVANAFLAQRISSINSISALCEKTNADIKEVSKAVGTDNRIGNKFLNASVGFGGSCFKKDILNLVYIAKSYGLNEVAEYWNGVIKINDYQKDRFYKNVVSKMFNSLTNKTLTLYGWAFKKNTNDSRESPSIYIAKKILEEDAFINIFDPKVSEKTIKNDLVELLELNSYSDSQISDLVERVKVFENHMDAVDGSHAILILTEWDEFVDYDYQKIFNKMQKPSFIFDGRCILDLEGLHNIGFKVYQIGK